MTETTQKVDKKIDVEQKLNQLALKIQCKRGGAFTAQDVADEIGATVHEDLIEGFKIYGPNDYFLTLAEITLLARVLKNELEH